MLRYKLKLAFALILLAGLSVVATWTFLRHRAELAQERELERPVQAKSRVTVASGQARVVLDESTQHRIGLETVELKPVAKRAEILGLGQVLSAQPLTDLRKHYLSARFRTNGTKARVEASRQEYTRLRQLGQERNHNVSAKAVQAAKARWAQDEASARAAKATLAAVEASARQTWGDRLAGWVFVSAPAFERLVRQRDYLVRVALSPGEAVASPASTCLIEAGKQVQLPAKLLSRAPRTDPRFQSPTFFYVLSAAKSGLLPGMSVWAHLAVGSSKRGVLIPGSAVVWWQGSPWAYVQTDPGVFTRRLLSSYFPVEGGWFVGDGVSAGQAIVVKGAALLLSEELRRQIQVGD